MIEPNSPTGKALLSQIRGGDYAHAGETEAIELTLSGLAPDPDRAVLDVGSGRGGSAEWVRAHGYGRVTGVDIDAESIDYARDAYPDCRFLAGDVVDLATIVSGPIDLAYSLNAFYAFPHLEGALAAVRSVAAHDAELRIFDYVHDDGRAPASDVPPGRTLGLSDLRGVMERTGWALTSETDLSAEYVRWYEGLCARIDDRRDALVASFGPESVAGFREFYGELLDALRAGRFGGALVAAAAASETADQP